MIREIQIVSSVVLGLHSVAAQVYTPPAQPAPARSFESQMGPSSASELNDVGKGRVLGVDVPFFDPGSELASWDGHNWNITNNRVFQARFEKYLNAEEADTAIDAAYRETLDGILAALSPRGSGSNLARATALMEKASQFPIDARLCDSLANAIYGVWLAQRNIRTLRKANSELEKEMRKTAWNIEVSGGGTATSKAARKTSDGEEAGEKDAVQQVTDYTRTGLYIKKAVELEALRARNSAEMAGSELKAKVEFQTLIIQFFLQRRFEHVVIATRVYRSMFGDGDSNLKVEEGSEAAKVFRTGIGVNPTISTLDAFANEAIRDVDEGVRAFKFLVEKDELQSASKRLSEAFAVGEYLPRIRTLPRSEKRKVVKFVQDSNQLVSALEVKDYTLAEQLVERLRKQSVDFDFSKPLAAVQTAKTIADMHIQQALLAAQRGNDVEVRTHMEKALIVYPTNPKLREVSARIVKGSDIRGQAVDNLDRLIAEENYRTIFKDQGRYLAAVFDDPARQEALRQILTNVQRIDTTIQQAEKLSDAGSREGAWELVEKLYEEFPQDALLSSTRSDLATDVADFVRTLKNAAQLEERRQHGSALAWFLKARAMYPSSIYAAEGIKRLVDRILPEKGVAEKASEATTSGSTDE